ncbi:MAG: phosphoribosyl-ATP diphosphatase [Hyphomicrobiaceae bacterium]|nr:phosphoribosyl-ATP diphosphatase [Hyphomicrobiaceae bacterium]
MSQDTLLALAAVVRQRRNATGDTSYTRKLLDGGVKTCGKKLAEEAAETIMAAVSESDEALKAEAADLLYHLIVLLEVREVSLSDVIGVLEGRMGRSGVDEKAARGGSR